MDENKPDILEEKPLNALEIHNASTEDILAEQIKTPDAPETKPSPATDSAETPPQQSTEAPTTQEAPTPPVDPEELKNKLKGELTTEISDEVAKKVMDALAPERDKGVEAPWIKENRQPTYEEAIDWAASQGLEKATPGLIEKVSEKVKADLQKEVEDEEAAAQVSAQEEASKIEGWEKNWENEFGNLESEGKLPKANLADERRNEQGFYLDPGRRARQEIFGAMQRNIAKLQQEGKAATPSDYSAELAFYKSYHPKAQPPGADAPIYGAGKSVGSSSGDNFSAAEIHNTSLESLLLELGH